MDNCIFCKIVKGDIPCYKVYEDDKYLGFLDIRPLTAGNSLLIPKDHHRWVFNVPNFGEYFEAAKKISMASQKVLKCDSISLLTLGREVPHAHIRIIPRYPDDLHTKGIDSTINLDISKDEMQRISTEIFTMLNS